MNIIRYHTPARVAWPSRSQFSALSGLFDSAFSLPETRPARERIPAVEVSEDDSQFTVRLEAVGLTKEDFEIALHDHVLTITGERGRANKSEEKEDPALPLRSRAFSRSLTLSGLIHSEEVRAVYQDGILTVTLPKAEAAKPRKVEITSL